MNLDERYRCPQHPNTTIGKTPGVDTAPRCQMCGGAMRLETRRPAEAVPQQDKLVPPPEPKAAPADPRRQAPQRGTRRPR